jgi:two-component system, OmpR family, KDP operon response regulator KdpE
MEMNYLKERSRHRFGESDCLSDHGFTANVPRILIVDDEVLVLRFLNDALDREQYRLYQAENGHAALAAVATVRPDVVLLDLRLPDMYGIEVIRRIREWSQVPIIVISIQEDENDKVSALDVGADDYLTKPFSVEELRARIRAVLRRPLRQAPVPLRDVDGVQAVLSARESEILFWVKEGKSNWEIAVILAISERTVKFHIRSIMEKLNAVNRSHALAIAIKHGMIGNE